MCRQFWIALAIPLLVACHVHRDSSPTPSTKASTSSPDSWEVVKTDKGDDPEWVISSRQVPDTTWLEYKIEGHVPAPPEVCLTSFRNSLKDQQADSKKFPTYETVDSNASSILYYVIHNEPFFLKDTEMGIRYRFSNTPTGDRTVVRRGKKYR